jgi:hypothetical protein
LAAYKAVKPKAEAKGESNQPNTVFPFTYLLSPAKRDSVVSSRTKRRVGFAQYQYDALRSVPSNGNGKKQ